MAYETNLRDKSAIMEVGSGRATYIEVDDTGCCIGTAAKSLPWIKSSSISDETEQVDLPSEGDFAKEDDGRRTTTMELVFMQKDKATVESMVTNLRGKYLAICKEQSDRKVGSSEKYQYLLAPICKVRPNVTIDQRGHEISATFRIEPVLSAKGFDPENWDDTEFATAIAASTITFDPAESNNYWQYFEE